MLHSKKSSFCLRLLAVVALQCIRIIRKQANTQKAKGLAGERASWQNSCLLALLKKKRKRKKQDANAKVRLGAF